MKTPWECPRCQRINSPTVPHCDCKPPVYESCPQCIVDAHRCFSEGYPGARVITMFAAGLHEQFCVKEGKQ